VALTTSVLIDLAPKAGERLRSRLAERFGEPANVDEQRIADAALALDPTPSKLSTAFDAVLALDAWTAWRQLVALADRMDPRSLRDAVERVASLEDVEKASRLLYALSEAVPGAAARADRLLRESASEPDPLLL
jgi:hypothetical protein